MLFRGDEGFVAAVEPFVRDGLDGGESVILALAPHRLRAMRDALRDVDFQAGGPDCLAPPAGVVLTWPETASVASRMLPSWQRFATRWGDRPVRGVTEPMWSARRQAERDECLLSEAMLNLAVPVTVPLWLACGYDVDLVPADLLDETFRSHAVVLDASATETATTYTGAPNMAAVLERALSTPVEPVRRLVIRPGNGAEVGDWVRRWATGWGLGQTRAGRLAGALRRIGQACLADGGRDAVVLLLWQDGHALIGQLTVTDPSAGSVAVTPDAGRPVPPQILLAEDSPLGAAVARADDCCDLVQVRCGPSETVVRVSNWL